MLDELVARPGRENTLMSKIWFRSAQGLCVLRNLATLWKAA